MPIEGIRTIDIRLLGRLLQYDPDAGHLFWKEPPHKRADIKGSKGYRIVCFNHRQYLAHRLIWLVQTGVWPEDEIDHKNRNRSDNSWSNLRLASPRINAQNREPSTKSKAGVPGIYLRGARYAAQIWADGKNNYLGTFDSKEQANAAYVAAKRERHEGCHGG